jgi:hypothetical protein
LAAVALTFATAKASSFFSSSLVSIEVAVAVAVAVVVSVDVSDMKTDMKAFFFLYFTAEWFHLSSSDCATKIKPIRELFHSINFPTENANDTEVDDPAVG